MSRAGLLILATSVAVAGCDQSDSDMGAQRKATAYSASAVFADGATLRPAVAGTLSRDPAAQPAGGEDWLPAGAASPLRADADAIDRGQVVFEANCAACHGRLGNGDGMIVRRGFPMPPSLHVDRLRGVDDAHLFNVVTHGYGAMYAYGDRIAPADRWAIVAYVRALQAAPDVADAQASARQRATLLFGGDPNARKAGAP